MAGFIHFSKTTQTVQPQLCSVLCCGLCVIECVRQCRHADTVRRVRALSCAHDATHFHPLTLCLFVKRRTLSAKFLAARGDLGQDFPIRFRCRRRGPRLCSKWTCRVYISTAQRSGNILPTTHHPRHHTEKRTGSRHHYIIGYSKFIDVPTCDGFSGSYRSFFGGKPFHRLASSYC